MVKKDFCKFMIKNKMPIGKANLNFKVWYIKILSIKSGKNWSLLTGHPKITRFDSVRRNPRSVTSLNHVRSSF